MQSQGSIEFARVARTGAEWTRLLGVTAGAVTRWKAGHSKPADEVRKRIHAHGGPEPQSWNQVAGTPPPKAKKRRKKKLVKATPGLVVAEADFWLEHLKDLRSRIASSQLDVDKELRLLANAGKILSTIGKLTGVGLTVSVRQIIDSPNWRILEAKIIDALAPWPDALRAVADALDDTRGSQP